MPSVTSPTSRLHNTTYARPLPPRRADQLPVNASMLVITGLSGGLWYLIVRGFLWITS